MNTRATIRLLPDGRRLHLSDGPIDLIIGADGASKEARHAYQAAAHRFVTILDELCDELPLLRARATLDSPRLKGHIARRMSDAVSVYGERCFITPMAAVAGAVSEAVLVAMIEAAQLDRAYVNNGGDIALHLSPGQSYAIGMIERPEHPSLFGKFEISASVPVRGIATSGWRGRSFSLGIADAVTVLARNAAAADAAATIIANSVNLPDHPAIRRVPACEISPDSDLLDLPVTRAVGPLCTQEIFQALQTGATVAQGLQAKGWIHSAALYLQGRVLLVEPSPQLAGVELCAAIAEEANDGLARSQRNAHA
ncbi:MAG TPA: UPF0280 family protein [Verrucomicrobiae bacterium]|nr:UPF0280 family protein [Verrucomicrobiae bacterium]